MPRPVGLVPLCVETHHVNVIYGNAMAPRESDKLLNSSDLFQCELDMGVIVCIANECLDPALPPYKELGSVLSSPGLQTFCATLVVHKAS